MKLINLKILSLLITITSISGFRPAHSEMDPITTGIIIGVACTSGTLIGVAGSESYNQLNNNNNNDNDNNYNDGEFYLNQDTSTWN